VLSHDSVTSQRHCAHYWLAENITTHKSYKLESQEPLKAELEATGCIGSAHTVKATPTNPLKTGSKKVK
jgi:hypothetical protein